MKEKSVLLQQENMYNNNYVTTNTEKKKKSPKINYSWDIATTSTKLFPGYAKKKSPLKSSSIPVNYNATIFQTRKNWKICCIAVNFFRFI